MIILFLPFLVLYFISAKVIYFYLALLMLIPVLISPLFEHLFDIGKEVGHSDEFQTVAKWVAVGALAIVIYFMLKP